MAKIDLHKEQYLVALLYVLIIAVLLYADYGILTGPGISAALLGIYFTLTYRPLFIAVVSVSAAACSFIGQSMVAYCPYCTIAATGFLIAGTFGLLKIASKYTAAALVLCTVTVTSVGVFALSFTAYADTRNPIIENGTAITFSQSVEDNKAKLYLSTTCPSCKDAAKEFVESDPLGKTWQPVIVPHSGLAQGEKILKELGYQGEIISASYPPGQRIPVLERNGEILTGKKIVFKEVNK